MDAYTGRPWLLEFYYVLGHPALNRLSGFRKVALLRPKLDSLRVSTYRNLSHSGLLLGSLDNPERWTIAINANMRGLMRTRVVYHEFAHWLCLCVFGNSCADHGVPWRSFMGALAEIEPCLMDESRFETEERWKKSAARGAAELRFVRDLARKEYETADLW